MPPFAFAVDESADAMVRAGLMKVALLHAAYDVRAHILRIAKSPEATVVEFDRDIPQDLIVAKLAQKMPGAC